MHAGFLWTRDLRRQAVRLLSWVSQNLTPIQEGTWMQHYSRHWRHSPDQ